MTCLQANENSQGSTDFGRLPERKPASGITVLIIGAGVGGLLACLECWRQGHDVRIVERSASRMQSGDGFTIGSSALRAFRNWPEMEDEEDRIAMNMWVSWHKINGEKISGPGPFELHAGNVKDDTVEPPKVHRHSRPKFHKMLSKQVERTGTTIEYGKRVKSYFENIQTNKAGIILDDGNIIEADVVIAADGVGSKSSQVTMGHEIRARPTGYSIYRAAFPVELALSDPVVAERFQVLENGKFVAEMWMGDGVHAMFARSEDEMSWALNYPDREVGIESWSALVDPKTVLKTTANIPGWADVADRVIKATPKEHLHDFKLMWREPQPCWTSSGGRVVQIGDAAHTFLPSSGNGGTQAIEDAISLAACLHIAGKDNTPWATRVHNKLRFERVACLQKLGVVNHELRNRSSNADVSQTMPVGLLGSWIWSHDPERYAIDNYGKVLAHLKNGTPFQSTNIPPGHVYKPWTIDELLQAKESGKEIELDGDWD
ncbi:hypothetical protein N7526_007509 [Penicillium atrosanguineum]|nr:hypothetical protein N7526_007509 [Penicillium atrosanguineum]